MSLGKRAFLCPTSSETRSYKFPKKKKEKEIDCLSEFKKVFAFGSNVNILLTFQKVDQDWSEYVDLDEDSVLCHKDKIKVVVTHVLFC